MKTESRTAEGGFRFLRVAGIDIRIDPTWFILFFLILWSLSAGYLPSRLPGLTSAQYWTAGLAATLLLFASLLAHELTHSFMAIRNGIPVPAITLFVFGGAARIAREAKDPKTEFKIAVVGPLCSFLLAGIFWLARNAGDAAAAPRVDAVLRYLAFVNAAIGVFNLVPGYPLDGGRIFRAFWWWRTGSLARATRVASDLGKGVAVVLMVLGGVEIFFGGLVGGLWLIFIGLFLRGLAEGGYRQIVLQRSMENLRVEDMMMRDVAQVPADLPLDQAVRRYFFHYSLSGFPVTRGGDVVGLLSLEDIEKVPEGGEKGKKVEDVMTPLSESMRVRAEVPLLDAVNRMAAENLDRLLVVRNERVIGMVTRTGLTRLVQVLAPERKAA